MLSHILPLEIPRATFGEKAKARRAILTDRGYTLLVDRGSAERDSPLDRLVAHFINCGYDLKTMTPHLARVAGRNLDRGDVENVLLSLLDAEYIFGCALSPEDREAIRDAVVLQPERKLPRHLQAFGQIRRMRKFLLQFP